MTSPQGHKGLLVLGLLAIAFGLFEICWTLYAFDASFHLGSPIRRIDPAQIETLVRDPTLHGDIRLRPLFESYGVGKAAIHVLGYTLNVLTLSGVVLVIIGVALIGPARGPRTHPLDATSPGVAP